MTNSEITDNETVREQVLANPPVTTDFILNEWVRTEFTLPESIRINHVDVLFLRVWEGGYVVSQIHDGKLTYNGVDWIVHWASTPTLCAQSSWVGCSFRQIGNCRYVVIKLWGGRQA